MKKIFKIAFANLLAFSIAPALAVAFNQSKEVTSVQAEETVVTADQVKYQDGDTVKTFEELPTGYTFENGVLTVTNESTKDYSIWVEDTNAGNLTIVFERDYGGGESSIYFEYLGKKKLTLTSIDSVDVTLGALYTDVWAEWPGWPELEISGKVNLKIVGGTTEKFETYQYLVGARTFNLLDDASVYSIDPDWPNSKSNDCSIIYIRSTVNINTTGYVKVGFNFKNHDAYASIFLMSKDYFNLIRCDGQMMFYCKIWDFDDPLQRRDYKTILDLDFDEYVYHQEGKVGTIIPGGFCHRTRIRPYIVSYDPNGGTGEMDFYGGRIGTIKLPTCTFTPPTGKRFKCWKLQGYSIERQPGDDFEMIPNRDFETFDAIWENALTGTVSITGSLKYDKTLTASVTDTNNTGTLSYQWRRNGDDIASATSRTYLVTEDDIGYTLSVVVTSSVEAGSIVGTASGVISKADAPSAPKGITATACTTEDNNDGVLKGVTTEMEYKLSTSSEWVDGTGADITGLVSGTYNVRYKETSTHFAGQSANVVVNAYNAPVVPPTLTPSSSGLSGGAIVGIVIGSILVAGIGGFALVWFVIKKKTWADFVTIIKK